MPSRSVARREHKQPFIAGPAVDRQPIGTMILSAAVAFFASGYSPPGICGEVLRHNQSLNIDASPLFYTDVENMDQHDVGLQEVTETFRFERCYFC